MNFSIALAVALPLVAFAVPAAAFTTITQTVNFENLFNDRTFSFNQFDASLGALSAVELSYNFETTTIIDMVNGHMGSRTFNVAGETTGTLSGYGLTLTTTRSLNRDYNVNGRTAFELTLVGTPFSASELQFGGLNDFVGSGTLNFDFDVQSAFSVTPFNVKNGSYNIGDTSFDGLVTMTYYYDAAEAGTVTPPAGGGVVPEPSTWAMLILGFGLVGGVMRSRRGMGRVTA